MLIPNDHPGGLGDSTLCIDLPEIPPLKSLYAVWPGEQDLDCICPLCDGADCVWNNCQYSNFSSTPKLQFINTTIVNGTKKSIYNLCWPKLQVELNNTTIHFFYEEISCTSGLKKALPSFLSRKFIKSDNIIVYGQSLLLLLCADHRYVLFIVITGPPLAPSINVNSSKICFNSYSFYPIDYYIVNITDVINGLLIRGDHPSVWNIH